MTAPVETPDEPQEMPEGSQEGEGSSVEEQSFGETPVEAASIEA